MIPTTYKTIVLAPWQVLPMSVAGTVFSCAAADATFQVSFDGQAFIQVQQGWTYGPSPAAFKQLVFQNLTAVQVTVTFYAGATPMFYSPPTTLALVTDAPTYAKGGGIAAIGAGAVVPYTGLDGAHRRKQIMVTNLDAAAALYLQDGNGNILLPIFAGESKTLAISGSCKLSNPNGAPVSAVVGEVFYS